MAGIKISALPAVVSALTTDFFPVVQGGITSRETLAQVQTLFGFGGGILDLAHGGTNAALVASANSLVYSTATQFALLASANNGVLITSGAGVPSISSTLPTAVQANITQLGAQSQALNMNTHLINNVVDPVAAQDAATKNYVDVQIANFATVFVARLASTTALTVTYANGSSGVGATLTNAGAMVALTLDGVAAVVGNLVLIKDQASTLQNGYYTVTNIGSGATNWVLTRSTAYDQPSEITPGDIFVITSGTVNANTSWIETATVTAVGVDAITFAQYSVAIPIPVTAGGTGRTTSTTAYGLIAAGTTATGALQTLATGSAGQVLQSGGAAALPTYSTATYPATAGTSGNVITSDGTNFVSSAPATFNTINIQTFTANGTYTPTSGMKYCIIEALGGGGGGGGSADTVAGVHAAGGGGGAGSYARKFASAATIGVSQAVTIGAAGAAGSAGNNAGGNGGDTSVGAICIGKGGIGGAGNPNNVAAAGGAGGIAGTGDFTPVGNAGSAGFEGTIAATVAIAGMGASSVFGGSKGAVMAITNTTGANAANYGAGGNGAIVWNAGGAAAGGTGSAGVVIVTEYI
jgi:hypothetical protein